MTLGDKIQELIEAMGELATSMQECIDKYQGNQALIGVLNNLNDQVVDGNNFSNNLPHLYQHVPPFPLDKLCLSEGVSLYKGQFNSAVFRYIPQFNANGMEQADSRNLRIGLRSVDTALGRVASEIFELEKKFPRELLLAQIAIDIQDWHQFNATLVANGPSNNIPNSVLESINQQVVVPHIEYLTQLRAAYTTNPPPLPRGPQFLEADFMQVLDNWKQQDPQTIVALLAPFEMNSLRDFTLADQDYYQNLDDLLRGKIHGTQRTVLLAKAIQDIQLLATPQAAQADTSDTSDTSDPFAQFNAG